MKIRHVEVLHADAGWRPWSFVKVMTDEGLIGWSECTDSHGSPSGIAGVVKDLTPLLVNQDPRNVERICWEMYSRTRQSPGSIIQKGIGGIVNALWDIKAKALGIPVYELFGGALRDTIPLYWSHCGTSRVRASNAIKKPQIKSPEDLKEFGEEVRESGYKAVKTNLAVFGEPPFIYMPGFFKSQGGPEMNADRELLSKIDQWVGALRRAVGEKVDVAVDLNFNFRTEGYIKVGRMLEQYDLLWLEIDSYDAEALRQIKDSVRTPIASCENLYGVRQYRPFFVHHAMDIAAVDVIWNGFSESKRIAEMAELYEMNVCPHNYNGHLSTFISMQFCALVPNLRLAEIDVDDVPWRDELFTRRPQIEEGCFKMSTTPGWGTEVDEKVLAKHRWPK